jgi:hypothetical protein
LFEPFRAAGVSEPAQSSRCLEMKLWRTEQYIRQNQQSAEGVSRPKRAGSEAHRATGASEPAQHCMCVRNSTELAACLSTKRIVSVRSRREQ